jgi:hypothetical protein
MLPATWSKEALERDAIVVGVTPSRMFTSFMHKLLGVTILPFHGMHDKVSSSPPTSMHPWKTAIPTFQELGMAILRRCIEVGREDDTLACIP